MHKHDLDLIAEYAGGTLDDTSRARSLVESCPTCAGEYRRHRSVIESLSTAAPAAMTEHEKAALHRDLWTELRSGNVSAAPASPGTRWQPLAFGAAAVVFVAVALFGVLDGMGGDGAVSETFSEIASGLDADSAGADGGGESEEGLAPADAPRDLSDLYSDTPYARIARQVRVDTVTTSAQEDEQRAEAECLEMAGLADHEVVDGYENLTELLVAVPMDADLATAPVSFVDTETCTVVHVEE